MLGKSKLVIEIMTFAVTGLALLLPGIGATTACACVSVDWLAAESVNRLDALVHQYAVEHNGLYPTYNELVTMAEQRDKKYMTPQIDMAARSFSSANTWSVISREKMASLSTFPPASKTG